MTMPYAYIECAGVRVPADCTVEELRIMLEKRNIRFNNEEEIMAVFGNALQLKASLEKTITVLKAEISTLDRDIIRKGDLAKCPGCGRLWREEPNKPQVKSTKQKADAKK